MGYCTPTSPEDEPLHSWITCPRCDGKGISYNEDGEMGECIECNGEGEVIFEQE